MLLNARLEGIRSRVTMEHWSAEQLATIFRDEIASASAELESFAVAGRRVGSPSKDQVVADMDIGWAYRLVSVFGARQHLEFVADCPGLRYLDRLGVPFERRPFVIEAFRQEQRYFRSEVFEEDVRDRLRKRSLDDDPLMRERASNEIAKARADVLLNSRSSYSDLVDLDKCAAAIPAEVPKPEAEPQAVPSSKRLKMPVSGLIDLCQLYLKGRREEIEPRTGRDIEVVVAMFVDILIEHGVASLGSVEQFHFGALRQHFDQIISSYGKSSRLVALSSKDLRLESKRRFDEAVSKGKKPPKLGLSPQTIRKHFGNLDGFLKYVSAHGYEVPDYAISGLRPKKRSSTSVRSLTEKPGPDRIQTIFAMPIFEGCKSAFEQDVPGEQIFHSANYFVPLLLSYLGPRRHEATGLAVKDIVATDNGYGIKIGPNSLRRIKNGPSIRMLPVTDELERLGFLDYVSAIRDLQYQALFPELYDPRVPSNEQDSGDRFYKDFAPPLQTHFGSVDEELWERIFHAIRHGHADTLKQAGVDGMIVDDISGRFGKGETATRYTNPAGLPLIREKLSRYPIITKHLHRRPVELLPWVREKRPAPWVNMEN